MTPKLPKSLHEVLSAMEAPQRNLFAQHLKAAPLPGQQRLLPLLAVIEAHVFAPSPPAITWEEALDAAGILPSQLDKLLSILHQRLDQYLGLQHIQLAPHRYLADTIAAYAALKVDFGTKEKKWRQLAKKLQSERQSISHMRSMLDLEHQAIQARLAADVPMVGSHFTEMHRLLDQHHLLIKLKYACASINEAQLLQLPFPDALVRQTQEILASHTGDLPGWGQAYRAIFLLQVDALQPLAQYESVLALLVAQEPGIVREDNFDLFNHLLNLCYRRMDVGEPGFEALVARLYRYLIGLDLLAVDGEIHPRSFKNVVSIHCRQREFAFCLAFIAQHKRLLPKEDMEIVPAYCTGLVHFYQGEHAESARIFKAVIRRDPDDHFLSFESRNLLLKSYFHRYADLNTDEHEDLYKLVDAFRMYARRNSRLDDFHRKSYLNFIQYFVQLLRHMDNRGGAFPEALRKQIEAEKMITNKAWLLGLFQEKTK